MSNVTIIVLAAGASSRMRGADKLLEDIEGTPLLLRQTRAACRTCAHVVVVLPKHDHARGAWLTDTTARIVRVEDRAMSTSLRAGIMACETEAAMIVLADMPEIEANDLAAMIAAHEASPDRIIQATTEDGTPGQPVIFPKAFFPALMALEGDRGARSVIDAHGAMPCPLRGQRAVTDLDTPEDWVAWRAARQRTPS